MFTYLLKINSIGQFVIVKQYSGKFICKSVISHQLYSELQLNSLISDHYTVVHHSSADSLKLQNLMEN